MKKICVVVAGTFDGIHPGHLSFLKQASELGNELVVIVARDKTVQTVKGHKPKLSEQQRCKDLRSLSIVKRAILGDDTGDFLKPVVQLQPDVLALGYDQWPVEAALIKELCARGLTDTKVVRLESHQPTKYHSSILKQKSDENS